MPNLKLRHATQFVGPYKVSVASEKPSRVKLERREKARKHIENMT